MKNIKGTSSLAGKNVQNSESIGNLTADTIRTTTLVATNGTITNLTNNELQTATSNITALQTSKQDVITDSTDIELNQLDVNSRIRLFFNDSTDNDTMIERSDAQGKLKFTANNVFFHDDDDTEVFAIKNNGDLNCFDNSIDNVADIDFNGSSLVTQLSTITSNISTNTGNISTNTGDISTLQSSKQDLIIDSTDIELNDIDVNGVLKFQRNNSTDDNCTINRSNNSGKMKFVGNTYAFRDNGDTQNLCILNNSGTLTTVSLQADFFSSITDTELDTLDGVTSNVQTQIDGKQDTITAGNGIDIVGTTISVDEAELTTKQDTITSSTSLSCAAIECNTNKITGVTSLSVRSIEINNTSNPNACFIDFGSGDYRLRQIYNEGANTFTFLIDDATGENPESKMVISRTAVQINNAELDMDSNDITDANSLNGITSTEISYLDGVTSNIQTQIGAKADDFATNSNGLIMDAGAFPLRELRLLFDATYFNINGSNELSLNKHINECKTTNFNLSSSGDWGSTTTTYPYISGWGSVATLSGATFLSNASNGIFSVNSDGLYKIVVSVAGENVAVNNRVILAVYLSIDDADTAFRTVPGEFLLAYLRDDNFAVGGSSEFTVYKTLTTSNTVRLKTRLGTGSDNRTYNDKTDDANLNVYTSFIIEKID